MLFFIFYIQNQQQSRAKTTKNRPQTRRNPPLLAFFTNKIGRKSQFFTTKTPIFHHQNTLKYQIHINLI